jgi:hypothetical protein
VACMYAQVQHLVHRVASSVHLSARKGRRPSCDANLHQLPPASASSVRRRCMYLSSACRYVRYYCSQPSFQFVSDTRRRLLSWALSLSVCWIDEAAIAAQGRGPRLASPRVRRSTPAANLAATRLFSAPSLLFHPCIACMHGHGGRRTAHAGT